MNFHTVKVGFLLKITLHNFIKKLHDSHIIRHEILYFPQNGYSHKTNDIVTIPHEIKLLLDFFLFLMRF